jgi:hypothetical protein
MQFKVTTERYYLDYGDGSGEWQDKPAVIRDDCVKLIRTGSGREGEVYFTYFDQDTSFKFFAEHCDEDGRATDTWQVYLGLALQQKSGLNERTRITPPKARDISANIEQALRAWPLRPGEPPVRQVKFLMVQWAMWDAAWGDWL